MTNLSEFHVVFSSSALIRLNKDAIEGTCAKPFIILQNRISRAPCMSPLIKRRLSQLIHKSETLDYLLLTNCCLFWFPKYTHYVCWWWLSFSADGPLICMSVSVIPPKTDER